MADDNPPKDKKTGLLIATGEENEAAVLAVLSERPDRAAAQVRPGEVAEYGIPLDLAPRSADPDEDLPAWAKAVIAAFRALFEKR